jgi:hypothetical protein
MGRGKREEIEIDIDMVGCKNVLLLKGREGNGQTIHP